MPLLNRLSRWTAAALAVGCSLLALARPFVPWDTWWYHLPFSGFLWNIGGGAQAFHLSPLIEARWLGFPKAWEWIQGLVWAATGTLYSLIVPQMLLCAAYLAYLSRGHRVPFAWVIFAFFASPMLFIHFQAVYVDLPAAICVSLGLLLMFDLLEDARTPGRPFPWLKAAACILSLGVAGNIKYQSLLAGFVVLGSGGLVYLFTRGIALATRAKLIAVLLIAGLAASATAIRNGVVYGNPAYPLSVTLNGTVVLDGPENPQGDAHFPTYRLTGDNVISVPRPVSFILSATELDWTLRGIPAWYNIDSSIGMQSPQRGTAGSRTGGLGGLFFTLNACLIALQLLLWRREADRTQRHLLIGTVVLLVATSAFPSSHEVRYWLYIPLVMIAVNLRYLSRHHDNVVTTTALALLMVWGVAHTVISPNSDLFSPRTVTVSHLRSQVPPKVLQQLEATGRYCYPLDVSSLLPAGAAPETSPFRHRAQIDSEIYRYSTAVTGLPGLISGVAADCGAESR